MSKPNKGKPVSRGPSPIITAVGMYKVGSEFIPVLYHIQDDQVVRAEMGKSDSRAISKEAAKLLFIREVLDK